MSTTDDRVEAPPRSIRIAASLVNERIRRASWQRRALWVGLFLLAFVPPFFSQPGRAGIINMYADPFQVHEWPEFFEAMKLLGKWTIPSYGTLIRDLEAASS